MQLPSSTDFIFSQAFIEESLKVTVDGVINNDFTIDMPSRRLSLGVAPRDDARINLTYEISTDKTLEYDISGVQPDKLESFAVTDVQTGEAVAAVINLDNKLSFDRSDVRDGRQLKIEYNTQFTKEERRLQHPHK